MIFGVGGKWLGHQFLDFISKEKECGQWKNIFYGINCYIACSHSYEKGHWIGYGRSFREMNNLHNYPCMHVLVHFWWFLCKKKKFHLIKSSSIENGCERTLSGSSTHTGKMKTYTDTSLFFCQYTNNCCRTTGPVDQPAQATLLSRYPPLPLSHSVTHTHARTHAHTHTHCYKAYAAQLKNINVKSKRRQNNILQMS